jgi:hypothetical protein
MRGEFFLVRWALPTIAISSDSREELYELAYMVESALAEAAMGGSRVDDHADFGSSKPFRACRGRSPGYVPARNQTRSGVIRRQAAEPNTRIRHAANGCGRVEAGNPSHPEAAR